MAIAIFPVIILVIGILLYFVSTNGKVQEVGRLMFFFLRTAGSHLCAVARCGEAPLASKFLMDSSFDHP